MCAPSLRSARRQKTGGEDGLVTVVQIPNGGGIESKDISGVSVIRLRGLVGLKAGASITTLPLPPDRTRHFLSGRFRLGDWSCLVLPVVDVVDLGRGGGTRETGKRVSTEAPVVGDSRQGRCRTRIFKFAPNPVQRRTCMNGTAMGFAWPGYLTRSEFGTSNLECPWGGAIPGWHLMRGDIAKSVGQPLMPRQERH